MRLVVNGEPEQPEKGGCRLEGFGAEGLGVGGIGRGKSQLAAGGEGQPSNVQIFSHTILTIFTITGFFTG